MCDPRDRHNVLHRLGISGIIVTLSEGFSIIVTRVMIGAVLSHYKIVEKLGEGGMGVVYKARDTKLDRTVALKFLPAHLHDSEEERVRFLQEAKAAAALNHPNVCSIIDIQEYDSQSFIVMEFVDGQTLHEKLQSGSPNPKSAVEMGVQIARALAHAHRRNIVHRDINTSNIMVTREGEVKIMDFGLAALAGKDSGAVAGTVAYMSPEQARGERLDHRTDIFSFGVILFELSTGRLPFRGDHPAALSYSILNEEPLALSSILPKAPRLLERIVLRCLEKDPAKRFQSADEIVAELRKLQQELTGATGIPATPKQISLRQLTFAEAVEEYPVWSPDGTRLVFSREFQGYTKLFLKNLADGRELQLTKGSVDDIQPAWSPDGARVLFVRSRQPNGKLEPADIFSYYTGGDIWACDVKSGKEQKFIENCFNPSFSPDGSWIAVDASLAGPRRIWLLDARGRNPRQLTSDVSEAVMHLAPRWSHDGSRIVFQNVERVRFDVRIVDVGSGKMDWVTDDTIQDVYPVWSPSGTDIILSSFRSGGLNIWSIPVGKGAGSARQLTIGAGQDIQPNVSPDGTRLVYSTVKLNADLWKLPINPSTGLAAGPPEPLIVSTREESRGAWSPDGTMIAFNSDRSGDMNIWVFSAADESVRQITSGAGGDFQPNWSPDGKQLSFFSARSGRPEIWIAELATGQARQLTSDASLKINPFFSPDGRSIAYHSDRAGRLEPWIMNSDGTDQHRLAEMETSGHFLRWFRDGKSVLFRSPNPISPGLWSASRSGGDPVFRCAPKGGAHISLSPDDKLVMDVVDHKEIWVTQIEGGGAKPVFKFDDQQVRIDYPVWSPDGRWVLFDRVKPQGGNIWLMENF